MDAEARDAEAGDAEDRIVEARSWRARLPDEPRWLTARHLLARAGSALATTSDGCVVWHPGEGLGALVGRVDAADLRRAAAACDELVVVPEDVDAARRALPGHVAQPATLLLAERPPSPPVDHPVRPLAAADLERAPALPAGLRAELAAVLDRGGEVWTSLADDRPVAFAYAAAITECLWDVSVDTLATHRRRGHAAAAVCALAHREAARGRRAVWGAAHDNPASLALARRLALREVDTVQVLTAP